MRDWLDTYIKSVNWKWCKLNTLPIVFGISMSLLDVVMMSLGKFASRKQLPYNLALFLGTLTYSLEPYIFYKSLNYESLTSMNLIWDLTSDIMVTLVGIFYFQEKLCPVKMLAVGTAFISLTLFAYSE